MGKIISIERNDLRSYRNGKKYKKSCSYGSDSYLVPNDTLYFAEMEGIELIKVPDDRDEAYLCYEVLSNSLTDMQEKAFAIENLHILIKSYPQIGDLWALLKIGYYEMGLESKAKKILKKSQVRFRKNLTMQLLCYFLQIESPPCAFADTLSTLTQIFIWGHIQVKRAFEAGDHDLAVELIEEMTENAEGCKQLTHWALGESIFAMVSEMSLDLHQE